MFSGTISRFAWRSRHGGLTLRRIGTPAPAAVVTWPSALTAYLTARQYKLAAVSSAPGVGTAREGSMPDAR